MRDKTLVALTKTNSPDFQTNLILQRLVNQFFQNWHWFILSLFLSLLIAMIFLRYKTPEYKINASLLVRDDTKGSDLGDAIVLQGLGLASGKSNVDNEVELLKSRTLNESVVKDLQLYVQYFSSGKIKKTEIYGNTPIVLHFVDSELVSVKPEFEDYNFSFGKNGKFNFSNRNRAWQGKFGDTLSLPEGKAILIKTAYPIIAENSYSVRISRIDVTVKKYSKVLSISATNKLVSTINLSLTETIPGKGEAMLSRHIANYLKASVNDKNRIADSTIAFIDENLRFVSGELLAVEKDIEHFRKTNHLADINESSRILLQNSGQTNQEQIENEVQLSIMESLQIYLKEHPERVVPASLAIHESNFTDLITKYNELHLSRSSILMTSTREHPFVKNLDEQLASLKENIENSIEAKKISLKVHISQLYNHKSQFQKDIDLVPGKERIFMDYSRQQQIKQELYIFLLKKRIETSLSKSSTLANGRIVDAAKADTIPFKPSRQLTVLLAILIGLGFPALVIYSKTLLNTRVSDKSDIFAHTVAPLIAEIGNKATKHINVFQADSPHQLPEQFRVLRTNLNHLTKTGNKIILLTSAMGGEGKSFIAINLATSLAMMNKKVILVEFDFRKPRLGTYLNISGKGIVDYLTSDKSLDAFIQKTSISEHLDILLCGTIPSDPVELISLPKTEAMIHLLTDQYDYVLFDSAPIGVVTDAQILGQFAQITLYVVRRQFTLMQQLTQIQELVGQAKLPKLNIVFNDCRSEPGSQYGYGYHENNKPKPILSRLLAKLVRS